jgi:hypothetical protein
MLIDLRVYTYLPSKFRRFLKGYEEIGFALTSRHLGKTLAIMRAESGIQNRTFQFFMYENSEHRDICRRGMLLDPAWGEFVKIDGDALLQQMNTLLVPTAFSPVGGDASKEPILISDAGTRIFELQTWICRPEHGADALKLVADKGAALFAESQMDIIGWFTADTGADYRIFLLSGFSSNSKRDEVRALAVEDSAMAEFQSTLERYILERDMQLLLPMSYSPLR